MVFQGKGYTLETVCSKLVYTHYIETNFGVISTISFKCYLLSYSYLFILAKNSSNVVSNIPPGVTPVMSTPYMIGQVPFFQPPMYTYEDMQLIQQRIPHLVRILFVCFLCVLNASVNTFPQRDHAN